MSRKSRRPSEPTAVRQIHLEHLEHEIDDLHGYLWALVVFRFRGAVVGADWLPVEGGIITLSRLRHCLRALAWPVWLQVVEEEPCSDSSSPTASVVVCTRDRTKDLRDCLDSLLPIAEQGHEVIVVDNSPADDGTNQLVKGYPFVRYMCEPRPGLDIARNCGLKASSGDIIAFTDDDVQVDPAWLSALLRNFDDPTVAVVTGITMPLELESKAQLWFEYTNGFGRGFVRKKTDTSTQSPWSAGSLGAGANMALRRTALDEIGFFDECLDCGTPTLSGGDQEFFYRTLIRGFRIVYDPAALAWHRHRKEWDSLRSVIYGYGVGVFAWWTRALFVERELSLLRWGPGWFVKHHVTNLVRSLARRPGRLPLDLAVAEFLGAMKGPISYLQSRRLIRKQEEKL